MIAAAEGPLTFFITFTCNADWPEIRDQLLPGQTYTDIPTTVCRVFKQKMAKLMQTLQTMFPNAGGIRYIIQRIEFQK
jgi:Helitron helicase-like domain at N-terminus